MVLPAILSVLFGILTLGAISIAVRARKAGDVAKEKTWRTASTVSVALLAVCVVWSSLSH